MESSPGRINSQFEEKRKKRVIETFISEREGLFRRSQKKFNDYKSYRYAFDLLKSLPGDIRRSLQDLITTQKSHYHLTDEDFPALSNEQMVFIQELDTFLAGEIHKKVETKLEEAQKKLNDIKVKFQEYEQILNTTRELWNTRIVNTSVTEKNHLLSNDIMLGIIFIKNI